MNINEFNKRFKYERDEVDSYHILKGEKDLKGDCDDYATTVAYIESGENIFKFLLGILTYKYSFWRVFTPAGEKHLVLKVRNKGYIDNFTRKYNKELQIHTKRNKYPRLFTTVYLKLIKGLIYKR